MLTEFTTLGDLVREVPLPEDVVYPFHAILFNDQFLVCHGRGSDLLNRICSVDRSGRVTRSYGGPRGSAEGQLSNTQRLAVDMDKNIVVADVGNNRILMLSRDLTCVRELVSRRDVIVSPWELCVSGRRLYVADVGLIKLRVFE